MQSWLRFSLYAAALIALVLAALLAIVRIFELGDLSYGLAGLAAARPYGIFLAVIGFIALRSLKSRPAMPLAVALIALHALWWVSPIAGAFGTPSGAGVEGEVITVYSANLSFSTGQIDDLLREVAVEEPDIVVVTELNVEHLAELTEALDRRLPHRIAEAAPSPRGIGLWSAYPIEASTVAPLSTGSFPAITAEVRTGSGTVTVVAVHFPPPRTTEGREAWKTDHLSLPNTLVGRDRVIVAGDTNSTTDHELLRTMLDNAGLRDAHREAGRLLPRTWPVRRFVPALIHIDHIFVNRGLEVVDAWIGDAEWGSDHRPVIAELVIPSG